MKKLVFDSLGKKALDLMENTSKHIFLTGKAGTGKSTLLMHFLQTTQKNIAVLAPTGIAALNIGGSTIHSFFKFSPTITFKQAKKLASHFVGDPKFTALDALVIDEVSMLRADMVDCIDVFLKTVRENKKAFGGVQMIMIGDLYQLPPVVGNNEKEFFEQEYASPYFFDAKVIQKKGFAMELVELEKIYRQSDQVFIDILNALRSKTFDDSHLRLLNQRVDQKVFLSEGMIYLAGTNAQVDAINTQYLNKIKKPLFTFFAQIDGNVGMHQFPTEQRLLLKEDAQVMFVANDPNFRWVNGTLGKIVKIKNDEVYVQIYDGDVVKVDPITWKLTEYEYNPKKKCLESFVVGTFTQIPLSLAWAVTIHKSQGKTFDKVIIDLSSGIFAHGQTYVALSRCRSLEGIQLTNKILPFHVKLDYRIIKFLTQFQYTASEKLFSLKEKIKLFQEVIACKGCVKMAYLKTNGTKSYRIFEPHELGKMKYHETFFWGVVGFCHTRKEQRVFRIDRILEIEKV